MEDQKQTAVLKPCPFCGIKPITLPAGVGGKGLMIECQSNRPCPHPHVSFYHHADSITAWNTRATRSVCASPAPTVQPDKAEVVRRQCGYCNAWVSRNCGEGCLRNPLIDPTESALSALPPTRDDSGLVALKPTEELLWILGQPNFACAGTANGLRAAGQEIARKAEAEQAAVILWMLNLYLEHGEKWRDAGVEFLDKAAKAAQQAAREV